MHRPDPGADRAPASGIRSGRASAAGRFPAGPVVRGARGPALTLLLVASAVFLPHAASAQTHSGEDASVEPRCSAAAFREFDFWIGEWEIEQRILQADGSWAQFPARTRVVSALDGCAILERRWEGRVLFFWEGMAEPERLVGMSLRTYDPEREEWTIHWVDTLSPGFGEGFRGRFEDGVGTFYRETASADGRPTTVRIRFFDILPDRFRWDLAVSPDGRESWTTLWEMRQTRSR